MSPAGRAPEAKLQEYEPFPPDAEIPAEYPTPIVAEGREAVVIVRGEAASDVGLGNKLLNNLSLKENVLDIIKKRINPKAAVKIKM